jgi:hypothetical protein
LLFCSASTWSSSQHKGKTSKKEANDFVNMSRLVCLLT